MPSHERVPYRVVVRGELTERLSAGFEGFTLEAADGTTAIVGPVIDQAHLQGLLAQIQNLGVELVSVNPLQGAARAAG
jgi:hypothetical protein